MINQIFSFIFLPTNNSISLNQNKFSHLKKNLKMKGKNTISILNMKNVLKIQVQKKKKPL